MAASKNHGQVSNVTNGINVKEAAKFIELLTGSPDAAVTFQTFHDVEKQNGKSARILHGTLTQHANELTRLNQGGCGVFVMVNAGDGKGRAEKNVTDIRAVFVDCDSPDQDPLGSIEKAAFNPDIIVSSSPGKFHAYRLVSGVPLDKELFKGFQLTLADRMHGDQKIHDLPRVLRVPGFKHQKGEPYAIHVHQVREGVRRVTPYADLLNEFGLSESVLRDRARAQGKPANAKDAPAPAPAPAKRPRARVDWDAEFSVSLKDGEGRNNHCMKLAGRCAGTGMDLDASLSKVSLWNAGNVEPLDPELVEGVVRRVWTKEAEKRSKFPLTEVGFAERFAAAHAEDFRYILDMASWVFWDGRTWCFDTGEAVVKQALKRVARGLLVEASQCPDDRKRAALIVFNKDCEKSKTINAARVLAGSDPVFTSVSGEYDQHPFLLATDNCVIDLKTGNTTPNSPNLMLMNRAFVTYDPLAECPLWEKHINEVTCGDTELAGFLQRVLGYGITGKVSEHKMFLFTGGGGNGKSTTIIVIEKIMGGHVRRISAGALMVPRHQQGDGPKESIASLKGGRIVFTGEMTKGNQLDEGVVKDIISEDPISVRRLHKPLMTFTPTHKVFSATNILPTISGTDNGIWRRICVVPFNATFEGAAIDANLPDKLLRESSGILNWLIRGCVEWVAQGLNEPESVQRITKEYRDELNITQNFIDECLLIEGGEWRNHAKTQSSMMYAAYRKYCGAYGLPTMSNKAFSADLMASSKGRFTRLKTGFVFYVGVTIRDEWKAEAVVIDTADGDILKGADEAANKARNEYLAAKLGKSGSK